MGDRRRLLEDESSSTSDEGDASGSGAATPGAVAGSYAPGSGIGRSRGHVEFGKLPWGIWLLEKLGLCGVKT